MMKTLSRAALSLKSGALIAALILLAFPGTARADCPTAPLGNSSDLVISFLATNATQVAPAAQMASTVKEGTLVYDPAQKILRLCDGTDWATVGEGTAAGQDPTVTFTNLTDQLVSTLVTTNIAQVTGLTIGVQVNIAGDGNPAYRICGDATCTTVIADWATDQGIIQNDQYLQLRTTTAATSNTTYTVTARVGSDTLNWTARTNDGTAAAFDFTDVADQTISAVVPSNIVTINNPSHEPMAVSVTGTGTPQISINGGAWGTSGTINDGQTLQVRLTTSASPSTGHTATVTVGTVSDMYTVTTATNAPAAYNFTNLTNQTVGTVVSSNTLTFTNTALAPMAVTVTGAGTPQVSIAGGAWASSGTMNAGQTLQVRMTSNGSPLSSDDITVTVAGVTSTWSVGTATNVPAAFTFTDLTGQALGALVTSNTLTISNAGAAGMPVTIAGGQISINGGAWTGSGTLPSGGTLQLRTTASAILNTEVTAIVTVAGVSDTWSVTSKNELYTFTSHTFTNCGATGRYGPTLANCTGAYSSATWTANTAYYNHVSGYQGYQLWTVPVTATYRFEVAGASGGYNNSYSYPRGRVIRADYPLTQGEKIILLVGQQGAQYIWGSSYPSSGGGGSFVAVAAATPATLSAAVKLMAAGGGGGYPDTASYGWSGSIGFGSLEGHSSNNGDVSNGQSYCGGASWSVDESHPSSSTYAAKAFINGGAGGGTNVSTLGGFGGGSACWSTCYSGGGGGYSGGYGTYSSYGCSYGGSGGGSGINSPSGYTAANSNLNFGMNGQPAHGYITITKL